MADEFTYTNYQVEDIERYLGGRMNAKDMHDMERAALQDPFLADAIEGLQRQPFAQTYQHLDEIVVAIQGEKEPAKILVLPVKRNYWWRAAAVIGMVVVAGAALWYVQSDKLAENKAIAAAIMPEKPQPAQALPPSKVASSDTVREPATATFKKRAIAPQTFVATSGRQLQESKQANVKHSPDAIVLGYATVKADSIVGPAAPPVAQTSANATDIMKKVPSFDVDKNGDIKRDSVSDKKLQSSVAGLYVNNYNNATSNIPRYGPTDNNLNVTANNLSNNVRFKNVVTSSAPLVVMPSKFEGFVVDDKNKPLANAAVYSNDKKHVTLTDSKGYFVLNTTDSQLAVQVASAGYKTKQVFLKNNTPNYISVNQDANLLDEVTVTEFKNKHLAKKIQADSLFPEGGWQSFREYVYKKLHKEKDMDTTGAVITSLDKRVEIEFVVDENGLAQDLKIIKSLNSESDAKALEVVQQWPHWIATRKDKKGKVVIQF